MNQHHLNTIVLAVSLAFSAGAMAQNMTKANYQVGKDKIAAEYKAAKAACDALSGNAEDICMAEAKGKEKVAKADLEASYKPTVKAHYNARVAKAEADYAVAKERCDDLAGNAKDVCVKEAKAAQTTAKANAKVQMKTKDANAAARETTSDARSKASEQASEARKDAADDKSDAGYQVAKEKCDQFSGAAKDQCQAQAKARFGK